MHPNGRVLKGAGILFPIPSQNLAKIILCHYINPIVSVFVLFKPYSYSYFLWIPFPVHGIEFSKPKTGNSQVKFYLTRTLYWGLVSQVFFPKPLTIQLQYVRNKTQNTKIQTDMRNKEILYCSTKDRIYVVAESSRQRCVTNDVFENHIPSDYKSPEFSKGRVSVDIGRSRFRNSATELGVAQSG